MKKSAIVFTAIVMLFASSAFASDGDHVTARVRAAFQTDFSTASKISWEKTNDFYFASFTLNNVMVEAAYNEEGELVGTSRRIEASQLPLNISMEMAKRFNHYELAKQAIELIYEGQTRYYITVVSDTEVIKLKCSSNGEIEVESKMKK